MQLLLLKQLLKKIAGLSPVPLTRNEYYDRLTKKVIKKVCSKNSVCIDVGANNGKILQLFVKNCALATHYAFEPIPDLYYLLKRKFDSACRIYDVALSNYTGISCFNYVTTDHAYSGLIKRSYDKPEQDTTIEVKVDLLDNIIPNNATITLIKIDVEGAEYNVLEGAVKTIERCKPLILFEFGKGGSDAYEITPQKIFAFLDAYNFHINLLPNFLKNHPPLTINQFINEYNKGKEYFFVAYPHL
jgi:FkbM family methyltransferase